MPDVSGKTLITKPIDTIWERWAASSKMSLMGGGELYSAPKTFDTDESNLVQNLRQFG
jgi:hypothetical protein